MTSISVLRAGAQYAEPSVPAEPARDECLGYAVLRSRAEFDALEGEWNDLFARAGSRTNVFQTFNWNWHWANHYLGEAGCDCELALITVRRQGRLVALWPLVLVRRLGLKIAKWMGEPVSQYGDALIDLQENPAEITELSWAALNRELGAHALHLRKIRSDAAALPLIECAGATLTAREEAPYLDLASAPDFSVYEERYSAKARKNRRRLARRLADLGPITLQTLAGVASARAAALDAIALKRRSLQETGRMSPALEDARFAAFFADAAEGRGRPCGCRVSRMQVGEQLAASTIDVTGNGTCAAHLIVHAPQFDACGAGTLMTERWIGAASDDGFAVFDFLAPAHAYKREWADGAVTVSDYAVATSPIGVLVVAAYYALLRPRVKAAVERAARWKAQFAAALRQRKPPRPCSGGH